MSFTIEPIQPPIVPLSLLKLHSLHNAAPRKRGADRSAIAVRRDAQTLEVRELAELRRQRAVQAVVPEAPVTARGTARSECPSPHHGTQAAAQGTAVPRSTYLPP